MTPEAATLERFQLHEMIGNYVDALNHRDWDRYKDCWIEDAEFAMTIANDSTPLTAQLATLARPTGVKVSGREAILKMVERYNNYPWLFQISTGIVAELESPTAAKIRNTLTVYSFNLTLIGGCYDRARKDKDGKWRLTQRDYRPSYWEAADKPGVLCRNMPDPNYLNLPQLKKS